MFHVEQRRSLSGVVVLRRAPAIQTFGLIRVVATRGFVRRTLACGSGEGLAPPRKILRVSFAINSRACARYARYAPGAGDARV